MAFRDYSTNPADNTTLGDGTYIGPNMLRNKVRPALQQIAADGKDLSDSVVELGESVAQLAGTLVVTSASGQTVSARVLIAALASPVAGSSAFLTEAGYEGFFVFSGDDLSVEVAADAEQRNYIAPSATPTGASGAWVRQFDVSGLTEADASVALTDSASIVPDFSLGRNFHVTLGGSRVLTNPINAATGQQGRFRVTQDATGSRTITPGSFYRFPGGAPTLSTAPGAIDVIHYYCHTETDIECSIDLALAPYALPPGTQSIGETETLATGSATSDITIAIREPVARAGNLTTISGYFGGAGTIKVRACDISGNNFTAKGATVSIAIPGSGLRTFTAPADFTALPLAAGDYIMVYAADKFVTLAGDQPILYAAGDTIATVGAQAGTIFATDVQVRLDVGLSTRSGTRTALIGDSTFAAYAGGTAVAALLTNVEVWDIATPGEDIAAQNGRWDTTVQPDGAFEAVVIQVGLNSITSVGTAAAAIAALQALVDEVKTDVRTDCKIIISQMTPCASRWYDLYGAVGGAVAYQQWLDINEAIAGTGGSPITGVDARVTSHVGLMGESRAISGITPSPHPNCLKLIYDTGDGIHPTTAGRQVNADAIRTALSSLGL